MTGVPAPLRIEIIDPIAEALPEGAVGCERVVAVAAASGPLDATFSELPVPLRRVGARFGHRVAPARRWARRWERRTQSVTVRLVQRGAQRRHDGNPRRDSRVRQHLFVSFDDVRGRLPGPTTVVPARSGRLELTTGFEPLAGGGVRAEAILRLWGSWPSLPLAITVEPWWRGRSVATVALRSNRRLRYPRRYFGAAHAAMREIRDQVARAPASPAGVVP